MFNLLIRNILLFFKDKATVALSFLAEVIIIALYFLFIRKNLTESFAYIKNIELLLDTWMLGGILGITSVTTTMGAYGIMVDDRAKNIRRDFLTAPIRKSSLMGGYMGSATLIGLVMSTIVLIISQIYIHYEYDISLGVNKLLNIFLEILLVTIANSSIVLLLISFLNSSNALAACCTILGSLIGFITGIYLPLGSLPSSVQWVVKAFPVSHGVSLIRRTILDELLLDSFGSKNRDSAIAFMEYMGISFASQNANIIILLGTASICSVGAILNIGIKKLRS